MTKEVEMPVAQVPYESSLKAAAEKQKWLKGTHFVKAAGALWLVPGCVGQVHAAVANRTGRRPGTHDWLAAAMYATRKGACENQITLITGGPRNNVWADCKKGLKPGLEGFNRKDVDPVTGKQVVFHCIRKAK